jgi:hypothetical protein
MGDFPSPAPMARARESHRRGAVAIGVDVRATNVVLDRDYGSGSVRQLADGQYPAPRSRYLDRPKTLEG